MDFLTALAFLMIIVFMLLIMSKRLSALVALIVIPIVFGLIAGFGNGLGAMMLEGIKNLAPTGVMLMFAILYFSLMNDAGLFDPIVKKIVHIVKGDPLKIIIGTTVLALFVSLDGDGSTTYIITVTAMLPLYKRLKINPLILACLVMNASGIMNITPWGGPTARAATALKVDTSVLFVPLIPAMIGAAIWLLFLSYYFGLKERKRLDVIDEEALDDIDPSADDFKENAKDESLERPRLWWINLTLTILLMVGLMTGILPLSVLFMIGFALAILINYPTLQEQKERLAAHAPNVLAVVSLIFAAGIFTGILSGTKMVDAMANSVVAFIPQSLGQYMAVITGLLSIPFTFFISNDAFYFGVLPILNQAAANYGISAAEIGRASLIGQPFHLLSPLVPSTYLLVGLIKAEFGDHQRFALKWTIITALVMLALGILTMVIPFYRLV